MATVVEGSKSSPGAASAENVININVSQNVKAHQVISKCMKTMSNAKTFPTLLRFMAVGRAITKSVSIVETLKTKLILADGEKINDVLEQNNVLSSTFIDENGNFASEYGKSGEDMDVEKQQGKALRKRMKSVLEISLTLKSSCTFSKDYDSVDNYPVG